MTRITTRTHPVITTVQALIDERQRLVGHIEAVTEADRREVLSMDRERTEILRLSINGSFFQRLTVKRRLAALGRRLQQFAADRKVNEADVAQWLARMAAIDQQLSGVQQSIVREKARRNFQTLAASVRH